MKGEERTGCGRRAGAALEHEERLFRRIRRRGGRSARLDALDKHVDHLVAVADAVVAHGHFELAAFVDGARQVALQGSLLAHVDVDLMKMLMVLVIKVDFLLVLMLLLLLPLVAQAFERRVEKPERRFLSDVGGAVLLAAMDMRVDACLDRCAVVFGVSLVQVDALVFIHGLVPARQSVAVAFVPAVEAHGRGLRRLDGRGAGQRDGDGASRRADTKHTHHRMRDAAMQAMNLLQPAANWTLRSRKTAPAQRALSNRKSQNICLYRPFQWAMLDGVGT